MPCLDSYLLSVIIKRLLGLDGILGGEVLLEVYIQQVTVMIHENCFRMVELLGRYGIQFGNEAWSG